MKTVVAIVMVFILLVGFGAFAYYYIDNSANKLISKASVLEKNGKQGNWQQAKSNFGTLNSSWDKASAKWTVLIDHQELDNINITMSRIKEYLGTKDMPGFTSEVAELKMLLRHIPEKEALNLKNVL